MAILSLRTTSSEANLDITWAARATSFERARQFPYNTSYVKHDLVCAVGATTFPKLEIPISIVISYHHYSREINIQNTGMIMKETV